MSSPTGFTSKQIEKAANEICHFGLTPLQSRVYVSLLVFGPSPAQTISTLIRTRRADVYRILRGLSARNLVVTGSDRPIRYAGVNPRDAIQILLRDESERLADLRERSVRLVEMLESIANAQLVAELPDGVAQNHFKLKFGAHVFDTWRGLISRSRTEIMKIWSPAGLRLHYNEGLFDYFRAAAERGVLIRGITELTDENTSIAEELSEFISLKHLDHLNRSLRFMIVDRREVFVNATSLPADTQELMSLLTDNASIVQGFCTDFEHLWNISKEISKLQKGTILEAP